MDRKMVGYVMLLNVKFVNTVLLFVISLSYFYP